MPTITYSVRYNRFNGNSRNSLIISPTELLEQFFFGIPICTSDGQELSQDVLRQKILAAQKDIEDFLSIKLWRQVYTENRDFILDQWGHWGHLQTTFLIRDVCSVSGFLGGIKQVDYPIEWISLHKTDDQGYLYRTIHMVPAGAAVNVTQNSVVAIGITPHAGFLGLGQIPNYWGISYETGFDQVPADLLEIIGKLAAIPIFAILGDIVLGAGIAAQSLAYDNLSESIQTTQSAENSAYSARIRQYQKELKNQLPNLRDFYVGIQHIVI